MRVLFLSPWFPYPPENGSKIRIYNLLKALAKHHEIRLLSFVRDGEIVDLSGLKDICIQVHIAPWREFSPRSLKSLVNFFSPKPRSIIDTYSSEMACRLQESVQQWKPDIVIFSQFSTAVYANLNMEIPCVFEEVELGLIQQNWSINDSISYRMRRKINWLKVRRFFKTLVKKFDACTVVSEQERKLLNSVAPDYNHVHLIPNGVDLKNHYPGITCPQPNTLIFNGALTYNANYDSMKYFLKDIFPLIHNIVPDATLKITGSFNDVDISSLHLTEKVVLTDYLPDIRPLVAGSWVCVVPLLLGGGTRLKILEAMALGTPVVATSKAAEGIAATSGRDILIADSTEEFVRQVVQLLHNTDLREEISQNGRQLVEDQYNWESIGQKFNSIIHTVASSVG